VVGASEDFGSLDQQLRAFSISPPLQRPTHTHSRPPPQTPLTPPQPVDMASYAHLLKLERFSGEEDSVAVTDFLDTLELTFTCLESIQDPIKRERAKVLTLQGHLEGKARQFWLSLRAEKKATFLTASEALKSKFPERVDDYREWAIKYKAISDLNNLVQGSMTVDKYAEKAKEIFNVLGDEYSRVLATKFMDGLADDAIQVTIDNEMTEDSKFPEMMTIYERCTKTRRRREMAFQQPELKQKEPAKSEQEMMLEMIKNNSQMVLQIGEMLKGLALPKQQPDRPNFGGREYQPIVGTVGSTQGSQNNSEYQKPRPNCGDRPHDRSYQPIEDAVCFTCGSPGHRAYECHFRNPPLSEEQDKQNTAYVRPGNSQGSNRVSSGGPWNPYS